MKAAKWFLIGLVLLNITGCGYTTKTILPKNIKTIYVETVKNKIPIREMYAYQPGLEMNITNAVIRRFQIDGNLEIVAEDEADAILKTDLIAYEQEGVRFNLLEDVEEYRLYIVVAFKLVDAKTGDLILKEDNFSGDEDYFVSDIRSIAREAASIGAVNSLAINIVDRIVEDW